MKQLPLFIMIVALLAASVRANEPQEEIRLPAHESYRAPYDKSNDDAFKGQHVKITVTPATFPYPLLKYRLHTFSAEFESGNAAPLYQQAYMEFTRIQSERMETVYKSKEYVELELADDSEGAMRLEIEKLKFKAFPIPALNGEASKMTDVSITPEQEAAMYQNLDRVFRILERASRQSYCDWSDRIQYHGVASLIPHIQEARMLARYLQGKANWEIRNGKYDDAVKTIRVGFMIGNHVEQDPFLISTLIGSSIHGMILSELRTLESQPDAPNFYPALTQVYFPGNAVQNGMQNELAFLWSKKETYKGFDNIDTLSADECRMYFDDVIDSFLIWVNVNPESNTYKFSKPVFCTLLYPFARDRLLQKGMSESEIEAMPVHQVVTPYLLEKIKGKYDNLIVLSSFPAGATHTAISADDLFFRGVKTPVDFFLYNVLASPYMVRSAFLRQKQTCELMKITEAIRYYAAVHDGKLPESLDAIKEVPVTTIDPLSGQPFGYRIEGNTVLIDYTNNEKSRLEITVNGSEK